MSEPIQRAAIYPIYQVDGKKAIINGVDQSLQIRPNSKNGLYSYQFEDGHIIGSNEGVSQFSAPRNTSAGNWYPVGVPDVGFLI